jgi:hypothetical protein
MTHPLKLNCLVLGYDRSHIFQVTVARTQSIADLKEGIRSRYSRSFLWKVSVRVNRNLKRNVESPTFVEEESPSSSVEELGFS